MCMKTYTCIQCGKENKWKYSSDNKFCSNTCQFDYKWINETIPRIERGECTHNSTKVLKKYLIEKCGDICSICGQHNVWNSKPLVLQLDHIDGDSDNNTIDNIRLMCPNCHTQTPTFGSRGKGNRYKKASQRNKYLQEYKAP